MKRTPRIYYPEVAPLGQPFHLSTAQTRHIQALRLKKGEQVLLFSGEGGDTLCVIQSLHPRLEVLALEHQARDVRSPLRLELGQSLARGEKMDFVIQKAVELGVSHITPLFTQHSNVKLDSRRQASRVHHWQQVAIAACEQCGRADIPLVSELQDLPTWLFKEDTPGLLLDPESPQSLASLQPSNASLRLLIGPEGGLSEAEGLLAKERGFRAVHLGPRILRTETAALCAISILQGKFGDLA